jgi:hypothetical protein
MSVSTFSGVEIAAELGRMLKESSHFPSIGSEIRTKLGVYKLISIDKETGVTHWQYVYPPQEILIKGVLNFD